MVGLLTMDDLWRRNQKTGPITMSELGAAGIGSAPQMMPPQAGPAAAPAPQRRGFLGGFFGPEGRDMRQRLAIGLEGMTLNPNQALIQTLQGDMEARKAGEVNNRTVAWLKSLGTPQAMQAAAALETGSIDAGNAVQFALKPAERDDGTALMQNYEFAKKNGFTGTFTEFMQQGGTGGTVVNVGGKAETAFETEAAKLQATTFDTLMKEGIAANGQLGQIDVIDQLLKSGVGGTSDTWKAWAQDNLGINIGAGGAVEALNATINQLVPAQRPAGSGSMSDKDVTLFKSSLPQLINSPEGNQIIVETMRGMANYKRQQGEIATAVALGQMTRQQGLEALMKLPDPMKPAVAMIQQMFPEEAAAPTISREDATRLLLGQ